MMNITPETIIALRADEVFVFGSNLAGRHGRGAAKDALSFGAKYGRGVGPEGQTYAIATKDHRLQVRALPDIGIAVHSFMNFARLNPHKKFFVTPIGCGLAGYSPNEIAPLFNEPIPENVWLPKSFWAVLVK